MNTIHFETTTLPISLYIHIPWCIKKCPYCDFNSYSIRANLAEEDYITRLLMDLQQQFHALQGRKLHSLFVGGGTPSLFAPQHIDRLLTEINHHTPLDQSIEITLEANPGSSDEAHFIGYHQAGINRLSIGVQSTHDHHLQRLGRAHNAVAAQNAMHMARQAGFSNVNIDLMFALPQQTLKEAMTDLATVIAWQPEHISWYQLTLEPNTYFHKYPPLLPNDDLAWEMQEQGQALLRDAGYHQYEVSAYAQSGHCCQHNLNYWSFGDYLGIGAGAHGKLTDLYTWQVNRCWCWRHPRDYLDQNHPTIAENNLVPTSQLAFEFMLNALRLQQPIPVELFTARTRLPLSTITEPLQRAQALELLHLKNNHFCLTREGKRYLNEVLELFL